LVLLPVDTFVLLPLLILDLSLVDTFPAPEGLVPVLLLFAPWSFVAGV
jgi:hypothetical protein